MLVLRELVVRELQKEAYARTEFPQAQAPNMYLLYHKRESTWWWYRKTTVINTMIINIGKYTTPVNTRYKMITCYLYQGSKLYDTVAPHVLYTTANDVIIQQEIIQQKTQGEYYENN